MPNHLKYGSNSDMDGVESLAVKRLVSFLGVPDLTHYPKAQAHGCGLRWGLCPGTEPRPVWGGVPDLSRIRRREMTATWTCRREEEPSSVSGQGGRRPLQGLSRLRRGEFSRVPPQPRRSTRWIRTTPPDVARRGRQRYRVVASGLDAVNGPNQQHHHAADPEVVTTKNLRICAEGAIE